MPSTTAEGLHVNTIYSASDPEFLNFPARRSVVHSTKGIVSSTQPLACQAGIKILEKGGNAGDAAVAVAAALNVTEPTSTGIGGDAFVLYYDNKTKKVRSLNGSGRSPAALTHEIACKGLEPSGTIPMRSVHAVTVPGAAAAWVDTVEKLGSGKLSLAEVLDPAIQLAENGYPVSEITSYGWQKSEPLLKNASPNGKEMLVDGDHAPQPGEIMTNKNMAETFRTLGRDGKKGYYQGRIAEAIVEVVKGRGGVLELEDLKKHGEVGTEEVEAISFLFERLGVELWECPPNGQGIVALMALGILEALENSKVIPPLEELAHNSTQYLHCIIESLRIAFADAAWYVTDPDMLKVRTSQLLNKGYLAERAKLFNPKKAMAEVDHGSPAMNSTDTVYFSVTDNDGNGCSFIISNYAGFGSCIVPKGCGFTLQNRGANFNLEPDHPNVVAPSKRPYHTIIPALVTQNGELHTVYGVMGGFMQPQGHVQVLLNMLLFKHNPQAALDAPRVCIGGFTVGNAIYLEDGIPESTAKELTAMGHSGIEVVRGFERGVFGRGQVIRVHYDNGRRVYSAGSDGRGDGAAIPLI